MSVCAKLCDVILSKKIRFSFLFSQTSYDFVQKMNSDENHKHQNDEHLFLQMFYYIRVHHNSSVAFYYLLFCLRNYLFECELSEPKNKIERERENTIQ